MLLGPPETSVLLSLTGDATHVGKWASYMFNANHSLNTLEEHKQYPSQLARPLGTMDTVGEKAIIVVSDEQRYGQIISMKPALAQL